MLDFNITFDIPPGFGVSTQLRKSIRMAAGSWVRARIMLRVQKHGRGSQGKLKGYSENPLAMESTSDPSRIKPIISPAGRGTGKKYRMMRRRLAGARVGGAPLKGGRGKAGPRGAAFKGVFFLGGYKEYKRRTGQVHDRFTLTNRGHFWRDWKVLNAKTAHDDGVVEIGWSRAENVQVANEAIEREPSRDHAFHISRKEMGMLRYHLAQHIASHFTKVKKKKQSA